MAGVSRAAVSRYFNNGYISKEKKEAIQRVVAETGYRPSRQAQILRTKRSKVVGVVIPKIDSPSIGKIVSGILTILKKEGYQMLLADTQNDPEKEKEYLASFNSMPVDGVILVGTVITEEHIGQLRQMKVPVVVAEQQVEGFCCVRQDDYHATLSVTRSVLEKGKKKLGYIGVLMEDEAAGKNRYLGYKDALEQAGIEDGIDCFVISDFTVKSGYEKMRELWTRNPDLEAVICATDRIAAGALMFVKEQRIRVPEDLWITGQGDCDLTDVADPRLTTIHYHYEDTGILSASKLLDIIEKCEVLPEDIVMDYYIVEKGSTVSTYDES